MIKKGTFEALNLPRLISRKMAAFALTDLAKNLNLGKNFL